MNENEDQNVTWQIMLLLGSTIRALPRGTSQRLTMLIRSSINTFTRSFMMKSLLDGHSES